MKNQYSFFYTLILVNIIIISVISGFNTVNAQEILTFEGNSKQNPITNKTIKDLQPEQHVSAAKNHDISNHYSFSGAMHFSSQNENRKYDVLSIPGFSAMSEPG
ncbi:MAG: hypothetical protein ACQESM_06370, partial [Bacteroidota bacterium]